LRIFITGYIFILLCACNNPNNAEPGAKENLNFLHDIVPFTSDSLVHVVIEIPAGTSQKWELNKENGQIEWEEVNSGSYRIVDYLAYPANYGFVPQTLLPEDSGGDGDPVDVFVLGSSISREKVVKVRIVGIIHMLDENESDSKLLAVDVSNPVFDVNSYDILTKKYPGVVEIIKQWLSNYKGSGRIEILSVQDEKQALRYLLEAHTAYCINNE
jgi:inorganic pyrophosphatase